MKAIFYGILIMQILLLIAVLLGLKKKIIKPDLYVNILFTTAAFLILYCSFILGFIIK